MIKNDRIHEVSDAFLGMDVFFFPLVCVVILHSIQKHTEILFGFVQGIWLRIRMSWMLFRGMH